MAVNQNMKLMSFDANADLSTKQYYAVTLDTTGQLNLATAAKNMEGILQNKPSAANQAATVCTDGITKAAITASTAITLGQLLEVDTGGTLKGIAAGVVVAKALEALSSVAGVRIISVEILHSAALFA